MDHEELQLHNLFDVRLVQSTETENMPVYQYTYKIRISNLVHQYPIFQRHLILYDIFRAAFVNILQNSPENAVGQLFLISSELQTRCISTKRDLVRNLNFEEAANRLEAVLQSDEAISLERLEIVLVLYLPTFENVGSKFGRKKYRKYFDIATYLKYSRCITNPINKRIENYSELCLPIALLIEKYVIKNMKKDKNTDVSQTRRAVKQVKTLIVNAKCLVKQANISPLSGPFNLEQAKHLIKALNLDSDICVRIFDKADKPILVWGKNLESKYCINLYFYYTGDACYHTYIITNIKGFFGKRSKICKLCHKKLENKYTHNCVHSKCELCRKIGCKNTSLVSDYNKCSDCNFVYLSKLCKQNHLPICCKRKLCSFCRKVILTSNSEEHDCKKHPCSRCGKCHSPFTVCYLTADHKNQENDTVHKCNIWYADFECQIDEKTNFHTPNLLILQKGSELMDKDPVEEVIYSGKTCTKSWLRDCYTDDSKYKNGYIVFLNSSGYDAHFIYAALVSESWSIKHIIRNCQKIISLTLPRNNIKLRDALLFIPATRLANYPKMFNLDTDNKGDFPHLLNKNRWVQFDNTSGEPLPIAYSEFDEITGECISFPKLKYFFPECKNSNEYEALAKWHVEQTKIFKDNNLKYYVGEQLVKYCRQDVNILRLGFTQFRLAWLSDHPDIEPLESSTFPSLNNKLFRNVYMPTDSIAMLPSAGFSPTKHGFSPRALAWISWLEHKHKLSNVITARKGYEVVIGRYLIDGTGVDSLGFRYVMEYNGCYYHGCSCIKKPIENAKLAYIRTEKKMKYLTWLSQNPDSPYGVFKFVSTSCCKLKVEMGQNLEMKQYISKFLKTYNHSEHSKEGLKLRAGLNGGRTNTIIHKLDPLPEQHSLYYYDFTSLYPAVQFSINNERYPIGYPDIYIASEIETIPSLNEWFGYVKLDILPPSNIYHPVLGQIINHKFIFHTCNACAQGATQNHTHYQCTHSVKERLIHGTYFTEEVNLALKYGYKIIHIYELWNWPKHKQSTTLFKDMIKTQYVKKALSSPLPKDENKLKAMMCEYRDKMGLELKPSMFKENPGMRALAKFILNNIWGYLGKRTDYEESQFVENLSDLLKLTENPNKDITRMIITNNSKALLVTWKPLTEPFNRTGNVALAACVTAYARIALYKVIARYPNNTVYFDTDSIFLLLPNCIQPPISSGVLGGLKNEILDKWGSNAKLNSFCSLGPKAYYYTVVDSATNNVLSEVIHLKGIKLNKPTQDKITSSIIRSLINPKRDKSVVKTDQHLIRKNIFESKVWNNNLQKAIQFQSEKRFIPIANNPYIASFPHGYFIEQSVINFIVSYMGEKFRRDVI